MRSTCSLYVDAGYLLASAATRATGTSLRSGIHVDYRALVSSLVTTAEERSGLPVLRVHWYDSARNGVPDAQQERIGELPKVKLRLGRFGMDGQQKGVDLRIGLDLVAHARNGAADVFFLVSGDDDLTEAVDEAQVHGVQVVVLGVPAASGAPHGVSRHLIRAADELDVIEASAIDEAVMRIEVPREPATEGPVSEPDTSAARAADTPSAGADVSAGPALASRSTGGPSPLDLAAMARTASADRRARVATAPPAAVLAYSGSSGEQARILPGYEEVDPEQDLIIDDVVTRVLQSFRQSASTADDDELRRARPSIPREVDRALLLDAAEALGVYDLSEPVRYRLRARFWELHDQ